MVHSHSPHPPADPGAAVVPVAKAYQPPALVDLGPIHSLTATGCDNGGSDSGMINPPPGGGGSICDWC